MAKKDKDSHEQNGRRILIRLDELIEEAIWYIEREKHTVRKLTNRGHFNKDGFRRIVIIDNQKYTITVERGGTLEP
jgi:hypothetical protein